MNDENSFILRGVISDIKHIGDKGFAVVTIESKGSKWDKDSRKFVDCVEKFKGTMGDAQNIQVGARIKCCGKLEENKYTSKEGKEYSSTQLKIELIKVFKTYAKNNEPSRQYEEEPTALANSGIADREESNPMPDDDSIPF